MWKNVIKLWIELLHRGIAQLVEHRSPKPGVGGSSPSAPAKKIERFGASSRTRNTPSFQEFFDFLRNSSSIAGAVRAHVFDTIFKMSNKSTKMYANVPRCDIYKTT